MKIRQKKMICAVLGFLSFFVMLCVIHGMETFNIGVAAGTVMAFGCEIVGAFLLYKAGVIRVR